MPNIQSLTAQQKEQISQALPAMGQRGSTDPARLRGGDIIAALCVPGGGNIVKQTFAAANTKTTIAHGLPYVPQGFIVIGKNATCDVFNDPTAADATNIYLQCTAATTVTLVIF